MNYTLITLWKTLDGTYYSNTVNKKDYDSAIGEYHAKFKPMQNDTNVATFTLLLIDEFGNKLEKCSWARQIEPPVEEAT